MPENKTNNQPLQSKSSPTKISTTVSSNDTKEEKTGRSNGINEAHITIILAYITFLGYICGYKYEVGFKGYFKIPDDYIEIDVATILKPSVWAVLFLFAAFLCLYILNELEIRFESIPILSGIYFRVFIYLICIAGLFLEAGYDMLFKIIAAVTLACILLLFEIIFFQMMKLFSWLDNKFPRQKNRITPNENKSFFVMLLLFYTIFASYGMEYFGEAQAQNQKDFLVHDL